MRRSVVVLLLTLGVPAVAAAAYPTGTFSGSGKVPGASKAEDRTVPLEAVVRKGECKRHVGLDETGNPETKQVRGTCLSFSGRASYQVTCTFASGARPTEQTVGLPSGFVVNARGVLAVDLKSRSDNRQATSRTSNGLKLTLRGRRATGTATYRSTQSSLAGDSVCEGKMTISLRRR
jgi:hypothetical protein